MWTHSQPRPRWLPIDIAAVLALAIAGCQNDPVLDSSNRGSGSHPTMTSVENAFIVPLHMPGECAIQVGDTAKLRFTATNNRDTETERLLYINTNAAHAVHISPNTGLEIPSNSSIAAGQPRTQNGPDSASLEVTLQGMRDSLRPGMSVDVTFGFDKAGPIEVRTPVEACPSQIQPVQ